MARECAQAELTCLVETNDRMSFVVWKVVDTNRLTGTLQHKSRADNPLAELHLPGPSVNLGKGVGAVAGGV